MADDILYIPNTKDVTRTSHTTITFFDQLKPTEVVAEITMGREHWWQKWVVSGFVYRGYWQGYNAKGKYWSFKEAHDQLWHLYAELKEMNRTQPDDNHGPKDHEETP